MKKIVLAGCVALGSFQVSLAEEGHSSGSGGSRSDVMRESAWFLNIPNGTSFPQIKYCIEKESDFGISLDRSQKIIEDSISDWIKYLKAKNLLSSGDFNIFADSFQRTGFCSGKEDITFYLGTQNSRTAPIVAQHHQPVGIAYKESYNYTKLWSRGFIWIAKDEQYKDPTLSAVNKSFPLWNNEKNFKAVVLHELGHVFGLPHVDGTIMRQDVWRFTSEEPFPMDVRYDEGFKNKIDHSSELFRPTFDNYSYFKLANAYPNLQLLLKSLGEREIKPPFRISFDKMYLRINDSVGEVALCLTESSKTKNNSSEHLFRQSFHPGVYYYQKHFSENIFGGVFACNKPGVVQTYVREYNLSHYPLRFSFIKDGQLMPILEFQTDM